MAQRGLPGMSALPEDSDVINMQQVSKQLLQCFPAALSSLPSPAT